MIAQHPRCKRWTASSGHRHQSAAKPQIAKELAVASGTDVHISDLSFADMAARADAFIQITSRTVIMYLTRPFHDQIMRTFRRNRLCI
jgi:hypothetical protein